MGTLRLITPWPFPNEEIEKMARKARKVIVLENNLGQLYPYIKAEAAHYTEVSFMPPSVLGMIHDPEDILRKSRPGGFEMSEIMHPLHHFIRPFCNLHHQLPGLRKRNRCPVHSSSH